MRKIITLVLMVVVFSTPCLAQVDITSIPSIEGTLWQKMDSSEYQIGFYGGKTYCGEEETMGVCVDTPFIGFFVLQCEQVAYGFLLPLIGFGLAYPIEIGGEELVSSDTWLLERVAEDWMPADE